MSILFSVEPLGIGSLEVESFSSYLRRLALAHSLTYWQLCRLLSGLDSPSKERRYDCSGFNLSGSTNMTRQMVAVVSAATNVKQLERTTFISLSGCIAASQAFSFKSARSWCPACIWESSAKRTVFYDRLIWNVDTVRRCPIHRVSLIDKCPSCSSRQTFFRSSGNLVACWKCGSDLATKEGTWTFEPRPSFGEQDVCELTVAVSDGSFLQASSDALHIFKKEIHRLFPNAKRSPLSYLVPAVDRCRYPTFLTLLKASHATGVSLLEVLTDPRQAAAKAGGLGLSTYTPPAVPHPHHDKAKLRRMELKMRGLLVRPLSEHLPSLAKLAAEFGVTTGCILHRNPKLHNQYMARRAELRLYRRENMTSAVRLALSKGLFANYMDRTFPSQDALVDELCHQCKVGKYFARTQVAIYRREYLIATTGNTDA